MAAFFTAAGEAMTGILEIGSKFFTWAMTNPLFIISIVVGLIFTVSKLIGIKKRV